MKLTRDQRFTAYCIMLQEFEDKETNDYGLFLCRVFEHLCGVFFNNTREFKQTLPELWDKRPEKMLISDVWYFQHGYGYRKRVEALKQCILETHPSN